MEMNTNALSAALRHVSKELGNQWKSIKREKIGNVTT